MEKPKPCPFCGGEAQTYTHYHGTDKVWRVMCSALNCVLLMDYFKTEEEAIAVWNRRVG